MRTTVHVQLVPMWVQHLSTVGIWFVTISIICFLLVYTRGFQSWAWFRNPLGRTIVWLDLCLLLLTIPSCISTVVGRITFFTSIPWHLITTCDVFLVGFIAITRAWVIGKEVWWNALPREEQHKLRRRFPVLRLLGYRPTAIRISRDKVADPKD